MLKLIIAGLGGQGVVFLTRLFAQSAVLLDQPVMVSETHGMSQRGGSVLSHIKMGDDQSPLIQRGTADVLLALEHNEGLRNLPYLRRGGVALFNARDGILPEVIPQLERLNITWLCHPADQTALEIGSSTVANVVMAGFSIAQPALEIPLTTFQESVKAISQRGQQLNLKALEAGYQAGQRVAMS